MKINRNSWHYKVWKWKNKGKLREDYSLWGLENDLNLCKYFWSIVLGAPLWALGRGIQWWFGFRGGELEEPWQLAVTGPITWLFAVTGVWWASWEPLGVLLTACGVIPVVFGTIAGMMLLGEATKIDSFWEITKEFASAKKRKVCPKLEVEG